MTWKGMTRFVPVAVAVLLLAAAETPDYEIVGTVTSRYTGQVYEVVFDRETESKHVRGPDGARFDELRDVWDAELRAIGEPKARIDPSLWTAVDEGSTTTRTMILVLADQPLHDVSQSTRSSIGRGADRVRAWRSDVLRQTALLAAATRAPVIERLTGFRIVGTSDILNAILIEASPDDLPDLLKRNPEIWTVLPALTRTIHLDKSVPTTGAKSFWDGGYDGTGMTVGVIDTGMDNQHPAIKSAITSEAVYLASGKNSTVFNDDATTTDDKHGHGTHIGGIIASGDTTYVGVAKGASLVNAKAFFLRTDGRASGHDSDIVSATHWAASRVDVFSLSFGSSGSNGDGSLARLYDAAVHGLSIPVAVSAGNSGPSAKTLLAPGDAYNVVTVGSLNDKGTTSLTDDAISTFSSRGPTSDGRRKPTLSAPGQTINSASNKWENSNDFRNMSGTSMAAPHMAGALAVLLDYDGTWRPESLKALLVNSSRNTSPYPTAPDSDWGWGGLNLDRAYTDRKNVFEGTLRSTGDASRYFIGDTSLSSGDRATLVWNRHVTFPSSGTPGTPPSLLDLDLHLYDGSTGAEHKKSVSGVSPVEQVETTGAVATPVLRVKRTGSFPTGSNGFSSEDFALATPAGFSAADPHDLSIAIDAPSGLIGPGQTFNVTVTVTNDGDLPALAPELEVTLSSGWTLVTGTSITTMSAIEGGGEGTAQFSVKAPAGTSAGSIEATVTSTGFGVTADAGPTSATVVVDAKAPVGSIVIKGGDAYTNQTGVPLALAATDEGSGVESMRIAEGDDWGEWETWSLNRNFVLSTGDGEKSVRAQFRDAAGNVSAVVTDTIRLDTTPPEGTVLLDDGAVWTGGTQVTATVAATDSDSGVEEMRYRIDGGAWSAWTGFATTRDVGLPSGDGERTVEFMFRDRAGNGSTAVSDTILVDRTPPTVSVSIEGDAAAINVNRVTLAISADDNLSGVVAMQVGGAVWTPLTSPVSYDLTTGEGIRSVDVRVRDLAGNVSAAASDSILVDLSKPIGSFTVNGGAQYLMPEEPMILAVNAADVAGGSGVRDGSVSFDGGKTWSDPYDLGSPILVAAADRPDSAGLLTASLLIRDHAGNVSERIDVPFFRVDPHGPRAAKKQSGRIDSLLEADAIAVDLVKGDLLTVKIKSKPDVKKALMDTGIDLVTPEGKRLIADRFPGTNRKPGISKYPAPETGRYYLVVHRNAGAAGTWTLKVKVSQAKDAKSRKGEGSVLLLEAAGYSILKGTISAPGLTAADIRILGPDGEVSFEAKEKNGKVTFRRTVLHAGTGTYEIVVPGPVKYKLSVVRPRS